MRFDAGRLHFSIDDGEPVTDSHPSSQHARA
jgi:hypothetical protein